MNPTICTETRPNSQFGHYFPSANLLFNRFVFVSHANVSNSESVTQIFPVNWWLIGVVSGQVYANIDLNHVTTLSILLSFSCPERRKFNLIICFLKKLSAGHLPHENNFQEPAHDSYHICHLSMSVRRQSMNYVQTKCVAHYSHTWARRTTGSHNVMAWMKVKPLTKKTVLKHVITTLDLSFHEKKKDVHTSLHQLGLHRLPSHVRGKITERIFHRVPLSQNSELIESADHCSHREAACFPVHSAHLVHGIFTIGRPFSPSRVRTKCATYRSAMPTPRDSINHHPELTFVHTVPCEKHVGSKGPQWSSPLRFLTSTSCRRCALRV